MIVKLCKCTKQHWISHFEWMVWYVAYSSTKILLKKKKQSKTLLFLVALGHSKNNCWPSILFPPLSTSPVLCSLLDLKSHSFSFHWMSYFALSGAELPILVPPNVGLTLSSSVRGCGRHRSPARAHTAAHLRPSTGVTGSLPGSVCAQHFSLVGVTWLA